MTKSKKVDKDTGKLEDMLPASYREFQKRPESQRYKLQCAVPKGEWTHLLSQAVTVDWTAEERDAVTRGRLVCPACKGCGSLAQIEQGQVKSGNDTYPVFQEINVPCRCKVWQQIWKIAKRDIPPHYEYVNLNTLKPSAESRLPEAIQQQEMDYIRKHRDGNFLILGSSGTGKTTLSIAMLREAFFRDEKQFWSPTLGPLNFKDSRWIWLGNFSTLLNQFNAKQRERFDSDPVPDPDVTPDKIFAAAQAGHRPFLLIEEVDKQELNAHRIKYLFNLVDTIINAGGQLVMTTNLTLSEFVRYLTPNDELRDAGLPILRRLIQKAYIRNHFEFYSG